MYSHLFQLDLFSEGILHPWQVRGLKRIATMKMRKGRLFMQVAQKEGIMSYQNNFITIYCAPSRLKPVILFLVYVTVL